MKIKKDDTVLIIKGRDRGKSGKVLQVKSRENRIIVEGANLVKKHTRAKKEGEKGKILEIPASLYVSNVKLVCKKCKKPTKTGYEIQTKDDKIFKVRICKNCGKET